MRKNERVRFMLGDSSKKEKVEGITCAVTTCEYHGGGNSCHAGHIKVGTEYAGSKDETICATYKSSNQ